MMQQDSLTTWFRWGLYSSLYPLLSGLMLMLIDLRVAEFLMSYLTLFLEAILTIAGTTLTRTLPSHST